MTTDHKKERHGLAPRFVYLKAREAGRPHGVAVALSALVVVGTLSLSATAVGLGVFIMLGKGGAEVTDVEGYQAYGAACIAFGVLAMAVMLLAPRLEGAPGWLYPYATAVLVIPAVVAPLAPAVAMVLIIWARPRC